MRRLSRFTSSVILFTNIWKEYREASIGTRHSKDRDENYLNIPTGTPQQRGGDGVPLAGRRKFGWLLWFNELS